MPSNYVPQEWCRSSLTFTKGYFLPWQRGLMCWFSLTGALPPVWRMTGREGGRISKIWKQSPEKAAEIIDSFFELTMRTCQKFSSRQSPLYSAWSALKEVSYILLPHQYASCINLDWELVQRNRSHVVERYWLKGECGLVERGNNMGPTQMKSMVHQ